MSKLDILQTSCSKHAGDEHHDDTGARIGMWLFLFSEFMLFGVLFVIYAVYRAKYAADFHHAAQELNLSLGSFNTFVLLTSSLTMVLSLASLQRRDKDLSLSFLIATICLGVLFLLNKFFEWREHYHEGLFPGMPQLEQLAKGEGLFYYLYYIMTGLHGIHVVAGIIALTVMLVLEAQDKITSERYLWLDNTGLYWHMVDIVWIFLLPLFYVIT